MELEIQGRKTYVMSDIHNDADRFRQMLRQIEFSKEDLLIIDGDIFDRGDNPADLYFEILKHDNICCVRGNHDDWVRLEIYDRIVGQRMGEYLVYNTFRLLARRLTEADMRRLADWIGEMPYYLELVLDGQKFQISHAQTYPTPGRVYDKSRFTMGDGHYEDFLTGMYDRKGIISVVGHTPMENERIWRSPAGGLLRIDCGNGFQCHGWGRLGAVRLNDMREYYV